MVVIIMCGILLNTFASNLKKYRLEAGLSQEKLAELCELHRTYISDIERGERNISLSNVERLSKALKIPASKLLEEE